MKLSMGSLFPSSKRSAKKKARSPSISGSNSSSSSSLDVTSSSRRRSSTPRSVLPPSSADLFPSDLARITPRQLESAIRRLSPDPPPPAEADLAAVIAGEISLDDLLSLGAPAGDDEIREAFAVFDADGDGRISAEELRRVLVALGDDGCSIDDCRRMIREVDTDGDGFVCFDDFLRMMNGHK